VILHQRECAKARGTQNLTKTSDKQKALMKKQPWESCIPPRPFPTISFFSESSLHAFISVLKKKTHKKQHQAVEHTTLHTEQRYAQVWQQAAVSLPQSFITLSERAELRKRQTCWFYLKEQ